MLARVALWFSRLKPLLRLLFRGVFWVAMISLVVLALEWQVWPRLATTPFFERLGSASSWLGRSTIIERTETVTISPDEGLERFLVDHRSAVVRVWEQTNGSLRALSQGNTGTLITNDGLVAVYRTRPAETDSLFTVFLADGSRHVATVRGYDSLLNILYLGLPSVSTPAVSFANSNEITAGRRVALLGLNSVTSPVIVPSVIRSVEPTYNIASQRVGTTEQWEGVLRFAVEASPELVGGPAFLLSGEMAGMVGTRVIDGATEGFILPARALQASLDRLFTGKLDRPVAGIAYISLTPARALELGVGRETGALVYSPSGRTGLAVLAGLPGALAGLQYGDVIIAVEGTAITPTNPLSAALGKFLPGEKVALTVWRNGEERQVLLAL